MTAVKRESLWIIVDKLTEGNLHTIDNWSHGKAAFDVAGVSSLTETDYGNSE